MLNRIFQIICTMVKNNADETKALDNKAVTYKNEYWPLAVLVLTYNRVQVNFVKVEEYIAEVGNVFINNGNLYVRSTERN